MYLPKTIPDELPTFLLSLPIILALQTAPEGDYLLWLQNMSPKLFAPLVTQNPLSMVVNMIVGREGRFSMFDGIYRWAVRGLQQTNLPTIKINWQDHKGAKALGYKNSTFCCLYF